MSEYIERGALMQAITAFFEPVNTAEQALMLNYTLKAINLFPAADVVEVKHGRCKFCGGKDNAFHILNAETAAYSGIELAINRQGMLRVRVYDDYECETALPQSSEIVMIAACPNCGSKMDGGADNG